MINEIPSEEGFWESIPATSDSLHIVFAYGKGCGPCAATKPKYEMVVNYFTKMNANIKFHMINMWDPANREFSKNMGIEVVPTFWGYYKGKRIWESKGGLDTAVQKQAILSVIDNIKLNFGVSI
jgi:thiol-disulfide isomerase/thioredoxin